MNWWMDTLKSVYGGGVFCALVMIGLNVRDILTHCKVGVLTTRLVLHHCRH